MVFLHYWLVLLVARELLSRPSLASLNRHSDLHPSPE